MMLDPQKAVASEMGGSEQKGQELRCCFTNTVAHLERPWEGWVVMQCRDNKSLHCEQLDV